jgi:hypothetical protein
VGLLGGEEVLKVIEGDHDHGQVVATLAQRSRLQQAVDSKATLLMHI